MKKTTFLAVALASAANVALAQKANDWLVRVGVAHVSPSASLQSVSSSEPVTNGALSGASVDSSSVNTLSFGVGYMLTDNVEAEFLIGLPPKLKLDLNVPSGRHPEALNTTVFFPAAVVNYRFGSAADALRPFVGVGISYNMFTKNGYNAADPIVGGLASNSISLNSTWSPVYKVGASYRIDDKLSVDGAALFMPIDVKGRVEGPGVGAGAAATDLSLKLKTSVYMVSMSYKF